MNLERVTGPECPHCGCTDSAIVREIVRWGQPWCRRRCHHCGRFWSAPREPEPEPDADPKTEEGEQSSSALSSAVASVFRRTNCPQCGSTKTKITSTQRPLRYHKCRDCGACFKTIEG